jgi:palmitoyltransferase
MLSREILAKNVEIWLRLRRIFDRAIETLTKRSLRESEPENGDLAALDAPQSADLILKNYDTLVEDLHYLNNLLVISRNMLATKETAQEICTRVGFNKSVRELITLCVNVTSKGYDGENVDDSRRSKVNTVTELCVFSILSVQALG